MRRTPLVLVALFLLCVAAAPALALWWRYPNDEPVKADNWPQPIVKAINAHRRVYGAGSWDAGWSFYFVGNTEDVNRFLAQVAEEKVAILEVVLVGEPGSAHVMSEPLGKDLKIDFAWSLHLEPHRERILVKPKPGETDEQYQKRLEQERTGAPEFAATVTVHCGGPIDQAAVKLPLRFRASVGGRLTNLARFHNERRERLEKAGRLNDQPPTDMPAAEAPRGMFGGPSTRPTDGG